MEPGNPPRNSPFTATAPAVILVTQTVTTTPDSPPYQPRETPPTSPPTTPRPEITNTIPPRHRSSPHLSLDSQGIEQITQTRSPSPPLYFCQRWDCHSRNKQTYSQVETATANVCISSTDDEFTPTTNDESFVDNDLSLVNSQPRCHQDHPHSPTLNGGPPATYPVSTSTTTKPPGGATEWQTSGIPALRDYPEPPGCSETAGPEDFKLEQRSSESNEGVVLR
ncbi:hypothetical protein AX16_009225 [Volvariella volvacea WC 439]|nr:hypothetical protein AX16_009225 [Volvariella volvacea WC 439]